VKAPEKLKSRGNVSLGTEDCRQKRKRATDCERERMRELFVTGKRGERANRNWPICNGRAESAISTFINKNTQWFLGKSEIMNNTRTNKKKAKFTDAYMRS
jgi:hypothetical protein